MFIPPHKTDAPGGAMGEGIAIDAAGNIYTAEATIRGVAKYVKNSRGSTARVLSDPRCS